MKFLELEKDVFTSFLDNHPLRTFFQTVEMEKIGKMDGWESYYVGVTKKGKLVAASRIAARKTHFGKKIFYAPRGLLVDYHNRKLLTFFVKELKNYIKKKGGYTLHIDPPLIYKERDINGDVVEGGISNEGVVETLKFLGFHHDGFTRCYDATKQVRWSFELPLTGKTEEQVLKEMNGNTRRAIQKAEHLRVGIRELKKEELSIFKEIMEKTSERREFQDKDLSYYEKMFDLFHHKKQLKYLVAEVSLKEALNVMESDKEALAKEKEKAIRQKKEARRQELESQEKNLEKRIEEIKKIKKDHLYLACAMFMIYGKDILYYHAGSYKEYMSFFGQYLIQWTMIKEAIALKKECYNFYGIKGVFDKNDKDYGVYLFKRGFHGHVIEYIGDFYLPVSGYYYISKWKQKLRKKGSK